MRTPCLAERDPSRTFGVQCEASFTFEPEAMMRSAK